MRTSTSPKHAVIAAGLALSCVLFACGAEELQEPGRNAAGTSSGEWPNFEYCTVAVPQVSLLSWQWNDESAMVKAVDRTSGSQAARKALTGQVKLLGGSLQCDQWKGAPKVADLVSFISSTNETTLEKILRQLEKREKPTDRRTMGLVPRAMDNPEDKDALRDIITVIKTGLDASFKQSNGQDCGNWKIVEFDGKVGFLCTSMYKMVEKVIPYSGNTYQARDTTQLVKCGSCKKDTDTGYTFCKQPVTCADAPPPPQPCAEADKAYVGNLLDASGVEQPLRLRSAKETGSDANVIQWLRIGDPVCLLSQSAESAASVSWYHVRFTCYRCGDTIVEKDGYVAADFITKKANLLKNFTSANDNTKAVVSKAGSKLSMTATINPEESGYIFNRQFQFTLKNAPVGCQSQIQAFGPRMDTITSNMGKCSSGDCVLPLPAAQGGYGFDLQLTDAARALNIFVEVSCGGTVFGCGVVKFDVFGNYVMDVWESC